VELRITHTPEGGVTLRRAALVVVAVAVAVLLLSLLGRHERASANSDARHGLSATAALTRGKHPSAYRLTAFADCLLYPVGGDPYALELCFDRTGRLIEAIDRHPRDRTRIWSVRYRPSLSPVHRDPAALFRELKAGRAFPASTRFTGVLPLSRDVPTTGTGGDTGPVTWGKPPLS
jgi:hypothetical protein